MRIPYIDDIQHPGTASHTGRIILRIYLTFDIITVYYISYSKMAFASDGCPPFGIRYSFIAIAVYYRNWPRYGLRWSGLCWHLRHSTSGTGRKRPRDGRSHECCAGGGSTNHDSADRMSGQFLFYHDKSPPLAIKSVQLRQLNWEVGSAIMSVLSTVSRAWWWRHVIQSPARERYWWDLFVNAHWCQKA